jgi:Flp pilus assembly protein TadG
MRAVAGAGASLRHDERGAALVEWAVMFPVLVLMLAVFFGTGRLWTTEASLLALAKESARAAVQAPDAAAAAQVAVQTADREVSGYGLEQSRLQVDPVGPFVRGGTYTVVVSYDVPLDDLPGFGLLPTHKVLTESFAEPIDRYVSQ